MGMSVRFWGVRGSIPSPGPETADVGGNTSCVEVQCGKTRIILDAGTGIRRLGDRLVERGELEVHLLLSHYHWDHIQGLPFFAPSYAPSASLQVFGAQTVQAAYEVLAQQMTDPVFPISFENLLSQWTFRQVEHGDRFRVGEAIVSSVLLDHPGGVLAFRIDHAGRSVVYATDTEQGPPDPALLALAERASVLIYDSQYTPQEYRGDAGESMRGRGHSTYEIGCAIAHAAKVERYVLFHHDPQRTDAEVARLERLARGHFDGARAAREGHAIEFDSLTWAA